IAVVVLRPAPPKTVLIILVTLSNLPAKCQMPILIGAEWNEFDGVQIIGTARCVPQIHVTFVVTKLLECRRLVCRRIIGHDLPDRKNCRAGCQPHPSATSSPGLATCSYHNANARSLMVRKV